MERVTYFFYGTLMDPAVASRVTGMAVTAARLRTATLEGYRRVCVVDQTYPAITPLADSRVEGRLFRNAPEEAQRRIAAYEEKTYILKWEWVRGPGGIKTRALVFVAGPAMKLTDENWDFEDWCRQHRRPFLMTLDRWTKEFERTTAVQA